MPVLRNISLFCMGFRPYILEAIYLARSSAASQHNAVTTGSIPVVATQPGGHTFHYALQRINEFIDNVETTYIGSALCRKSTERHDGHTYVAIKT